MRRYRWSFASLFPRRWARACALGLAVAVGRWSNPAAASAQEPLTQATAAQPGSQLIATPDWNSQPQSSSTASSPYAGDPLAPTWANPVCRVPNFFGDYFGTGLGATSGGLPTPLVYTGTGVEGGAFNSIVVPASVAGPGGPFILNNGIPTVAGVFPLFNLNENAELTALVQAAFPGATFVNGGGEFLNLDDLTFFYNYLVANGANAAVNLPNPAGGGFVGRNRYFDNGSPVPHDRIYFNSAHANNVRGLATPFNVNRYVFGGEKTFLDGLSSVEVRVPFAGTADSTQIGNSPATATATEFGNVGLFLKRTVVFTPNVVGMVGLGLSLPTAADARMVFAGTTLAEIRNRTTLLQPLAGLAWAPNDRFYAQSGLQFDLDPQGNPVSADNGGGLSHIGVLRDRNYAYFDNAIGYWCYENRASEGLTGIALQSELRYNQAFGSVDQVNNGVLSVNGLNGVGNSLNGTTGAIFRFAEQTNVSLGVSYPLAGDRFYDWNLQAQVNYYFGR